MSGTVRVATVYSVGLHVLPPHLKGFLQEHRQVNVRLEYKRTNEVYAACASGVLQFGIVAFPLRRAQIEVVPLWHDRLLFVCSPEHRLAWRRTVRLAELGYPAMPGWIEGVDLMLSSLRTTIQPA